RIPARIRAATYSADRRSIMTDSMPRIHNNCDSSMPAGPAPMMATCVRIAMASSEHLLVTHGYLQLPLGGSRLPIGVRYCAQTPGVPIDADRVRVRVWG